MTPTEPPALTIRKATQTDRDELLALVGACIDGMRSQQIEQWDEHYPNAGAIDRDLAQGTAYVGLWGNRLVAMIVVNEYQDPEYAEVPWQYAEGAIAVVHRLMVHPMAEGRRVARAMMAFAEQLAIEQGNAIIRLDAFSLNPRALRLYHALDYRDAGTIRLRKGIFHCFEKRLSIDP
jgi:GNAT superfamily N-acetyltransferase